MLTKIGFEALRLVYSLLLLIALPALFIRLLIKSQKLPAYRQRWLERIGINPLPQLERSLWIHAVSVGEVEVAKTLIPHLKIQHPGLPIVVTTTTPTGSAAIRQSKMADFHCYLPFDLSGFIKRLIDKIQPQALIIIETELWPNLVSCASANGPVILANARLSEKSQAGYAKLGFIMPFWLNQISLLCCADTFSKHRFSELGYTQTLETTGNIKFDSIPVQERQHNDSPSTWIAASTHAEEEAIAIRVHQALLQQHPQTQLLLAPRHPDRFDEVFQLIKVSGLSHQKTSQSNGAIAPSYEASIVLLDEMGQLKQRYREADIAFIGGSLAPLGGHNVLEPIAAGTPTITGPNVRNFQAIVDTLQQEQVLTIVENEQALLHALQSFFERPAPFQVQVESAQDRLLSMQGSARKTAEAIQAILGES